MNRYCWSSRHERPRAFGADGQPCETCVEYCAPASYGQSELNAVMSTRYEDGLTDDSPVRVAELSKNWPSLAGASPLLVSEMFQAAITVNRALGYRLRSWKLSRLAVTADAVNETIVAVFERGRAEKG